MRITFRCVVIGEEFILNGTRYRKQSTRTARMLEYHGAVFYVNQMAPCRVLTG